MDKQKRTMEILVVTLVAIIMILATIIGVLGTEVKELQLAVTTQKETSVATETEARNEARNEATTEAETTAETTRTTTSTTSGITSTTPSTSSGTTSTTPSTLFEITSTTVRTKMTLIASAYCPCIKCCGKDDGITATGTKATAGRTIAVDPRVIPYGSKVIINGVTYIAEDCGGAIKSNKIDIFFNTHYEALQWGIRTVEAEVIVYERK